MSNPFLDKCKRDKDGLNSVNDLEETRNWFVLRFWAVVYTVVFSGGDCFLPCWFWCSETS